ncbi:pro-adrenomedullin-like isoform X3 [Ahaetulla prasina]|nr:pro-adrenomedullin-like isoform X3 [Ahaetulla prasina]
MDSRKVFLMLIWLTTSSCQLWRTSGMTDRRQPPPAASFLEQLLKIGGRVNGRATRESDLGLEERPSTWAQLVQERDQLNLLRSSSVPGHRVPRQVLASPPARGCHLGTCQIQNLANLLYRYGGNNQKEESHKNNKGTNDPMGYGRRKRRAAGHGVSSPT